MISMDTISIASMYVITYKKILQSVVFFCPLIGDFNMALFFLGEFFMDFKHKWIAREQGTTYTYLSERGLLQSYLDKNPCLASHSNLHIPR